MSKFKLASISVIASLLSCSAFATQVSAPGVIIYPQLVVAGTATPNKPVVGKIAFNNLNSAGQLSVWNITCNYTTTSEVGVAVSLQSLGDTVSAYPGTFLVNGQGYVNNFEPGYIANTGTITWTLAAPAATANPLALNIYNMDQSPFTLNCSAQWVSRYQPTSK